MPPEPPEVWPPPIYGPPTIETSAPDDPVKVARQQAALGWIFLLLGLLAPPVFLPFAIYHGWKARRGGETVQGARIIAASVLLAALLTAAAWYLGVRH